jgi:hypothetical protein
LYLHKKAKAHNALQEPIPSLYSIHTKHTRTYFESGQELLLTGDVSSEDERADLLLQLKPACPQLLGDIAF